MIFACLTIWQDRLLRFTHVADNHEVKHLLCVGLVSSIVAVILAGRRCSEWGGAACGNTVGGVRLLLKYNVLCILPTLVLTRTYSRERPRRIHLEHESVEHGVCILRNTL